MCASHRTTAMLSYPNLRGVGPFTLTWWLLLVTLQGISSTTIPNNQNSNSENQTTPSTSIFQTVNSGIQTQNPSDVATIPGNLAPSSSNQTEKLIAVPTPSIVTSFRNVVLNKCKCDKDQMLHDNQCIDTPTFIPSIGEDIFLLNTSYFREISFGAPNCKEGKVLVPLYYEVSTFYLIENGTLLWGMGKMVFEDYCIEHIIMGDVMSLQAFVCIPSPRVPQCCQPGYVLDSDGDCSPDNDPVTFAPPVFVEGSHVLWPEFVEETVDLTCSAVATVKLVSLNGQGALIYGTGQAEIVWRASGNLAETLHEQNYCVGMRKHNDSSEPEYVAKVCSVNLLLEHQTTCNNATCVRKCCKEGSLLSAQACMEAHYENEIWQPLFHDWRNHTLIGSPKEEWSTIFGMPFCDGFFTLRPKVADIEEFYLLTNGSLHIPLYSRSYLPTDYCTDLFLDVDHVASVAVICAPTQKDNECLWKFTLINVLRGISCLFLAATLGVYLGVPDLRDRTNGRCLVSMVMAMLTSNISLIIISEVPNLPNTNCIIAAFVGHVSTLAIFFWLNIMCFDMWSTLRSSKHQHHSLKVFSLYSVYAWGCPLLVGVVALVLDLVKPKGVIRPKFTDGTCWFLGNAEFWLYLSGIIFILVVVNLLFFVLVAITLVRKLKQRKMMLEGNNSHTSKTNKTKEQAWLYVKLFIVMGVVWITDIFSSLHDRNECKYWVVTDVINVLQGVFIFLVAVVNKDNLKKIRSSWKPRMDSVRQSVLTLRGNTSNKSRNVLSIDSEASRKTSVTSLPRKLSVVSNIIFSTGNKNRTTSTIDENVGINKSKEATETRRASSESVKEAIPMEPLAE